MTTIKELKERIKNIEGEEPLDDKNLKIRYVTLQTLYAELKGRQEMGKDVAKYFGKILKDNEEYINAWPYNFLQREIKALQDRCKKENVE